MVDSWDRGVGQGSLGSASSRSRAPPIRRIQVTSQTPIFDELYREFSDSPDILHLPRYAEPASSKHTLYDATKLETIKPAIPDYQPYKKPAVDENATQEMPKVEPDEDETLLIQHPIIPSERPKLLTDDIDMEAAIKEADRDLGAPTEDDETESNKVFDEALRETLSKLKPTGVVTLPGTVTPAQAEQFQKEVEERGLNVAIEHVQPVVKSNVTPIKRDGTRLPKRNRNKRRGVQPTLVVFDEIQHPHVTGTSDSSSPGSAA